MSDDRSFERKTRAWLELGPTDAPDQAVEAALLTIESTRQERDLRIPWRLPTMNPIARLAGVAVVAILAVGVAVFALRPATNVGVTPTPTPTVSATAIAVAPPTDALAQLQAYRAAYGAVCDSLASIPDPKPSAAPAEVVAFLQATIAMGNEEVAGLEAIEAPPALSTEHLANIQTLKDVLALLNHEIDLLEVPKIDEATTVDEATGSLDTLREQFAAKYGLSTRCP